MDIVQLAYSKNFIPVFEKINVTSLLKTFWLADLQKWFREKHNIIVTVAPFTQDKLDSDIDQEEIEFNTLYSFFIHKELKFIKDDIDFKTYEEALEEGLQEALKLI